VFSGTGVSLPPCSDCDSLGTRCSCCRSILRSVCGGGRNERVARLEAEVESQLAVNRDTKRQIEQATKDIAVMREMLDQHLRRTASAADGRSEVVSKVGTKVSAASAAPRPQ
jgi:hypothetical protein